MLTQKYVRHLFDYHDGMLYRKHSAAQGKIKAGEPAGRLHKAQGRMRICIDGRRYHLHKIIYLWHHGIIPYLIDHIDCNPLNNRIENLREATVTANNCNKPIQKNNSSGIKGISIYPHKRMIHAQIQFNRQKIHKTFFPINDENLELAKKWIKSIREEMHGEYTNHG